MTDQGTREDKRCFRCEREVSSADLEAGRAILRDGCYVCPDCLDEIKKGVRHDDADALNAQLAAMTAEIRGISQHLHYEEFSWLFFLGGILQVVVLFLLYRAYQAGGLGGVTGAAGDAVATLLWAIVVQLMTITAFVAGRLK